jgi:outer membrane protein TolC
MLLALGGFGLAGAQATGETLVNLADGLTAQEAVALGLRQNAGLRALRKVQEVAVAGVSTARTLSNPELRMGWRDLEDTRPARRIGDFDVAVRWSPPRLGERDFKSDSALARLGEADAEIAAAEQKLAAEILFLHTKAVLLDEQIRLAEAAVALREQMVELIQNQVKMEVKSLFDQNVAELALADARSVPASYRTERLLCVTRLASDLDLPPGTEVKIQADAGPWAHEPRPLDTEELVKKAVTGRAELATASARYDEAKSLVRLRKRERYPWFSFFQVGRQFELESANDSWGFRLGIDLPIFKWNSATLRESVASVERWQFEYEALKRKISLEVEELVAQLRGRYARLEEFRQKIEPIAVRDRQLAQQAVALGQADQLQDLMAAARQLQRQRDYLADLLECRRLESELDRATGSAIGVGERGRQGQPLHPRCVHKER